ncbi:hypothetical protein [Marinactinospora rubrisoli]|uniref:ABC transmembrane type-1 domain-containing protein n=1 Tax=Marinactinospora rubrisoli TaxID=2715399 RepID=A0ABW2KKP4_9ACTN
MGPSSWLRAADRAARSRQARVAAHAVERIGCGQVVRAFGRERAERRVLARRGRRLADAIVRRTRAVGTVRAVAEATAIAVAGIAPPPPATSPGWPQYRSA